MGLIPPKFVREELDQLEASGTCSRALTRIILKEIKCVFGFALDAGYLEHAPVREMKNRKVPKKRKVALTHAELSKFLFEAKRRNHPYYRVWLVALVTGCRRSEIAGLKWTDFDFKNGLIYLQRQLKPKEGEVPFLKSKEDRVIAIPNHVIPEFLQWKLEAKSDEDCVITLTDKKWVTGFQAQVTRAFCNEIGIKEVTFHQLRATYITAALTDNIALGIVKENVGHAKLATTDEYFRASGIDMRGKLDGLEIRVPKLQDRKSDCEGRHLRVIK